MSTTPPEQPPARSGTTMASNLDLARLPYLGNAEFGVFLLVWLVIFLIWVIGDEVSSGTFATLTVALTFGYLISRGIAKASRVLEH